MVPTRSVIICVGVFGDLYSFLVSRYAGNGSHAAVTLPDLQVSQAIYLFGKKIGILVGSSDFLLPAR